MASGWTLAVPAMPTWTATSYRKSTSPQDFGPDRLLHNRSQPGKVAFALLHGERTLTTPRSSALGRDSFNGMGIDFGDLNADGVPDIFVSNITCNFGFDESSFVFLSTKDQLRRMHQDSRRTTTRAKSSVYRGAAGTGMSDWQTSTMTACSKQLQAAGATKGTATAWPLMQRRH